MASKVFEQLFTEEEISSLLNNTVVKLNYDTMIQNKVNKISFSIELNETLKNRLIEKLNLPLFKNINEIPMRWVKGDTLEHIDHSSALSNNSFENTYLYYLTDSLGNLVIDGIHYDIKKNTGYMFNEGILHSTINTNDSYRLMIGPMNEYGNSVGVGTPYIFYLTPDNGSSLGGNTVELTGQFFPQGQTDLTSTIVYFGDNNSVIGTPNVDGTLITCIAPPGIGSVPLYVVQEFIGGFLFQSNSLTYTYNNNITCFLYNSKILTDKGYQPIEDLRKGDLVQTFKHGLKAINMIGKKEIWNPVNKKERVKDQLYLCNKDKFPELNEPLVITGCHSILVENSVEAVSLEQMEKVKEVNGGIYLTDDKLRLPACVDVRTSVYEKEGLHTIYHLALDHDDYYMNYGIYANGLLVETCSKRYLKELSGMTLIE
jgi:hypothetical protein